MGKRPLCVAILWHMHQPDYGNEETGEIYLPWTRLHAVKDYYDMGALVAQVPGLHLTINVVPSMVDQLEAYAQGKARETYAQLTLRPASELTGREKAFLLRSFFQLPWKQMILPYARYKELLDRRGTADADGEFGTALRRFSTQDFLDLQVWFNLSWCGNELRRDDRIRDLFRKGRNFAEEDKSRLLEIQAAFIGRILPLYRTLMDTHGVEISVSPYYHPILPLLFDSRAAREAVPDIALPAGLFSYPADALEHVHRARQRFQDVFGRPPRGMWPSEGAISDAAAGLAQSQGLDWLASDEGVLSNSLRKSGIATAALTLEQRCRVWRQGDGPAIFFRDHALSDLIGFTYASWSAEEAVRDFIRQLRRIHEALPDDGRNYVVPVILDGENAWEHYPRNGADFLSLLYRALMDSAFLRPVTFSEYLELEPHREPLPTIAAGSWIYASLTTWIGHPEKTAAWEALSEARQALAQCDRESVEPARREKAFREAMIAEGSDWFWWYGDDHQTENAAEFDSLFRSHLKNVFRHLGMPHPLRLDVPIKKSDVATQYRNPVRTISPTLDGRVTSYFEWLSAGFATPSGGGSMHRTVRHLEKVYFGYDAARFYARMDFAGGLPKLPAGVSVRMHIIGPREITLTMDRHPDRWLCTPGGPLPPEQAPAVAGVKILEIGIPLEALGITEPDEVRFFFTLHDDGRELERFPSTGFLVVPLDPWGLDQQEWMV